MRQAARSPVPVLCGRQVDGAARRTGWLFQHRTPPLRGGWPAAMSLVAQLSPEDAHARLCLAAGLLAAEVSPERLRTLWAFACVSAQPRVRRGCLAALNGHESVRQP